MQLSLSRRSVKGVSMNAQYALGYSKGNTGGSNEATTAGAERSTLVALALILVAISLAFAALARLLVRRANRQMRAASFARAAA